MIKKAYNETECICRIKSLERDLSSALANADHWMSRKEESDRENARLNCLVDDCDSLLFTSMKRKVLELGGYEREIFITHTPELWDLADAVIDLDAMKAI